MKTYTTKEICERYGFSRQLLYQLRHGYTKGKYSYKPVLIEGEDWNWERGDIIFTEQAVEILDEKYNKSSQSS